MRSPRSSLLFVLAFAGGFHVMALEMCAFRALLFTFGSSIYVTGVLLTLVMFALSVGYAAGGRASERYQLGFLAYLLLMVAVYLNVVDVALGPTVLDGSFSARAWFSAEATINTIPPALAVTALYVPPMFGLALVSPYLIRRLASDQPRGSGFGTSAGNLMAVSTVGSIAGTLAGTFLLIPYLGVPGTVGVISTSLVLMAAVTLWLEGPRTLRAASVVGVAASSAAVFLLPEPRADNLVAQVDSAYGRISVYREVDEDRDEVLRAVTTRGYEDSVVYPGRPLKDQIGLAYVSLGRALGARRYLVLGVAGGGAIAQIRAADPSADVTGVELVPAAVELARDVFGVKTDERTHLVVEDARVFLRSTTQTYDYIIVDLFRGDHAPIQCATAEFFALVRARLGAGGVMFVNSNLGESEVDNGYHLRLPRNHFHSAILRAGFADAYQHDFFALGMVYAFRDAMPIDALLTRIADASLDPQLPAELRASLALSYLQITPVPQERGRYRPFTDEWVPETLLQERFKVPEFMRHTLRAVSSPPWRQRWERRVDARDLEVTLAGHLAAHWSENAVLGVDGAAYCAEVESLYRSMRDPRTAFAKYFWPQLCWEVALAPGPFADYVQALRLVSENRGPEALPALLVAVERLRAPRS